jgi:hypothetical protein
MGRTAFAFAVAYFLDPKQKIISTEAGIICSFIRTGSQRANPLFQLIARARSMDILHRDAFRLPIVTILSTAKLVKTPVSSSS